MLLLKKFYKFNLIQSRRLSISSIANNEHVCVRFAPSPTGRMHIGGLRIAFYNYLFAKKNNGKFLLRIEDTDRIRYKADSVDNIIESLKWTNLIPDHGPGFSKDPNEAQLYYQSNRIEYYKNYAHELIEKNFAYKCYCDENRLELLRRVAVKNQEKQAYDGKCRHLTQKQRDEFTASKLPYVIRFKLENRVIRFNDLIFGPHEFNLFDSEGDFVLLKSDGYPTYHFANIVDDHLMSISHVLRGQEWLTSTPKHLLLYDAIKWKAPNYAHFPLILNKDGGKLSKRNNDIDVMSFKERGYLPEALLGYLTTFGGGFRTNDANLETKYLNELVELFDLNYIVKRSIKYNEETLLSVNKEVLTRKIRSNDESKVLVDELRDLLNKKFIGNGQCIDSYYLTDSYLNFILNLTATRISKLDELLTDQYGFLWHNSNKNDFKNLLLTKFSLNNQQINFLIENLIDFIKRNEKFDHNHSNNLKSELGKELKLLESKILVDNSGKNKKLNLWLFYRIILCGNLDGPPIAEIICLLGKENILYRLNSIKSIFVD